MDYEWNEEREKQKYFLGDEGTRLCFANVSNYVGNVLFALCTLVFLLVKIKGPFRLRTRPTPAKCCFCVIPSSLYTKGILAIFIAFFFNYFSTLWNLQGELFWSEGGNWFSREKKNNNKKKEREIQVAIDCNSTHAQQQSWKEQFRD